MNITRARAFVPGYGAAFLLSAFLVMPSQAQQIPAGWKVITDTKKLCQIAVPASWEQDKIMKSMVNSPDKKANVIVHGIPDVVTYEQTVSSAKQLFKPTKVFEESKTRTFFSSPRSNKLPGAAYYMAISGPQVCDAQVEFGNPAMEAEAKTILMSLSKAK